MFDVQKLVDTMGAALRQTRGDYHITLGRLIEALQAAPPNAIVAFEDGVSPGSEESYRGYYSDLSFNDSELRIHAANFRNQCEAALNNTYEGYKGGDFVMDEDTPLWRSEYGSASGIAVTEIVIFGNTVTLKTKLVD